MTEGRARECGLKGVRLIISDACLGLGEGAARFFPDASWQRCVLYRNVFSHAPPKAAAMLKAIHAAEDGPVAREKAQQVVTRLCEQLSLSRPRSRRRCPLIASLRSVDGASRTNKHLERIPREIRRWTRVVGPFLDGQSALNLAAARLRHVASSEWSTKRYPSMDPLKDYMQERTTA